MLLIVGKFESKGYHLASFRPVNLFALPKAENTKKKISLQLAGACSRRPISIDFLVFLVQKYKEQIRRKSNTQLR